MTALSKGRGGVVLLLDEAQLIRDERDRHGEHPLSLLIAPVVALQRRELPLGLVVCGLPTLAGNLQKARSYSERLFRGEDVNSLEPEEALEAFVRPLEKTNRKADRAVAKSVVAAVRATRTSSSYGGRSCGTRPTSPASTASPPTCSRRHVPTSTTGLTVTSTSRGSRR